MTALKFSCSLTPPFFLRLPRLGVDLPAESVERLLDGLSSTSHYKRNSMEAYVSFVDFCELLQMDVSRASAEKMQEAVAVFSRFELEGLNCLSFADMTSACAEMMEYTGRQVRSCRLLFAVRRHDECVCRDDGICWKAANSPIACVCACARLHVQKWLTVMAFHFTGLLASQLDCCEIRRQA